MHVRTCARSRARTLGINDTRLVLQLALRHRPILVRHAPRLVRQAQRQRLQERAIRVVDDDVEEGREGNEHDHQRALRHRTGVLGLVHCEEEERGEADLLDVHPHEHVLDRLGEEQPAGVARGRLVELPEEEILPELVEEEEGEAREAVDDGRDDTVCERCDGRLVYRQHG